MRVQRLPIRKDILLYRELIPQGLEVGWRRWMRWENIKEHFSMEITKHRSFLFEHSELTKLGFPRFRCFRLPAGATMIGSKAIPPQLRPKIHPSRSEKTRIMRVWGLLRAIYYTQNMRMYCADDSA